MTIKDKAQEISSLLIAKRFMPKKHLREIFLDEELRSEVEANLKAVGLELATHIYTSYVAVKVSRNMESSVFSDDRGGYTATNNALSRGALALLAIIWSKIILPKRQMQIERGSLDDDEQSSLWFQKKPIPMNEDMVALDEKTLLADFGEKLGGKMTFYRYLSELARADFIVKKDRKVYEGPMLDTIVDYSILAPRIINGALGEMLGMNQEEPADDISDTTE